MMDETKARKSIGDGRQHSDTGDFPCGKKSIVMIVERFHERYR